MPTTTRSPTKRLFSLLIWKRRNSSRLAMVPMPLAPHDPDAAQPPQLPVCSGSSHATAPSTATTWAMPSFIGGALKSVVLSAGFIISGFNGGDYAIGRDIDCFQASGGFEDILAAFNRRHQHGSGK